MKQINLLLLTAGHLKRETGRDTLLSKVFTHVQSGWPKMVEDIKLGVCWQRHELTTEQGCLFVGNEGGHSKSTPHRVREELDGDHMGVGKMGVVSSHWQGHWGCCPTLWRVPDDGDTKLTPLHPWEFPDGPWRRIHVEFEGPFQGKNFLVIVNAYSKWRLWQWMKPPRTGQWMNCLLSLPSGEYRCKW